MRFGPVPLSAATGALLAHSLKLPGGRLKKGHVLSEADLDLLAAAGLGEVTVARLDPTDLGEDDAAAEVARALHDGAAGLTCSSPFTGRVNLLAQGPGVVVLDAGRITAANLVDAMITIATVPPFRQVHPGAMVATVKIISYGVPEAAVARASAAARGAIRLAAPVHETASLIVTETPGGAPGGPPGDARKGIEAIAARVRGLGMVLGETRVVAHDEATLAGAIARAGGDIVLILTASATSDINDTAPAALRRAGERVERFGMPVDPGNLLFLGALSERPVIGLPGSARSPVLHGADWVLSRVACGIEVTSEDIARMGVGGLLKEIPTRPQPRQRAAR